MYRPSSKPSSTLLDAVFTRAFIKAKCFYQQFETIQALAVLMNTEPSRRKHRANRLYTRTKPVKLWP